MVEFGGIWRRRVWMCSRVARRCCRDASRGWRSPGELENESQRGNGKLNFWRRAPWPRPHRNGRKAVTPPKAVNISASSPRPPGVLPSFLELSKQLSHLSSPPLLKLAQLFILSQNNHRGNPSFLRVTIGMCVISFALLSHARQLLPDDSSAGTSHRATCTPFPLMTKLRSTRPSLIEHQSAHFVESQL
jgi:hypothetical protein